MTFHMYILEVAMYLCVIMWHVHDGVSVSMHLRQT